MTQPYDIIGDIHGHADALVALLRKLGYEDRQGAWRHSERQAIFVGDFIDRGPKQVETVMIARRMVDAGSALAVMGNHEFNAIGWFLPDPNAPGEFLRPRFHSGSGAKNRHQHAAFLAEVEGKPLHAELIDWFLTLPLWLELPGLRVVHACWHSEWINLLGTKLASGCRLNKEVMLEASRAPADQIVQGDPHPSIFQMVDTLLKGMEIALPEGASFRDQDGVLRRRVRARWWDPEATTFRRAALLDEDSCAGVPDEAIPGYKPVYDPADKPLFIGHYWLTGEPAPLSNRVVCVDYSVAKGGPLCAYRWSSEGQVKAERFVSILP